MTILKDRSFLLGFALTFIFLGTGIVFLYAGLADYSWVFFLLLPVTLGMSIRGLPNRKWAYTGLIVCFALFLIFLIAGALEGFICVLMALPIVIIGLILGNWIGRLLRKFRDAKPPETLPVLLAPLLLFIIGAPVEKMTMDASESTSEVRSTIVLPYAPDVVYDGIKSMDTLVADKPWLMKLDLPIPYKCVLANEEVGGIRTCYFEGGQIVERITEMERGKMLRMDVIGYELMAAKWLRFRQATYTFEVVGPPQCHLTKMTRITSYSSALRPRFYWAPLEQIGIQQEHEYVFASLENKLRASDPR